MTMTSAEMCEIARAVVAKISPDENDVFDAIWEEYNADPDIPIDSADRADRELGMGGEAQASLVTLIVVPLLVQLGGAVIHSTIPDLVAWIKARLRQAPPKLPVGDDQIDGIAKVVVEEAQRITKNHH